MCSLCSREVYIHLSHPSRYRSCIKYYRSSPTRLSINHKTINRLRKRSRGVLLVRLDNLAASELLVGVAGVDDLLLAADNRKSGEAVVRAELTAPAGGDGEGAALGRAAVGLGGGLALDDVLAGGGGAAAGVDLEVPGAGGISLVA